MEKMIVKENVLSLADELVELILLLNMTQRVIWIDVVKWLSYQIPHI